MRMMGVQVDGPTNVFCDNESVVKNSTKPESTLKKKHSAIAYHRVREAQAAGIVRIAKEDGETNLADVLTWHVRDRRRPDGRRWHRGQADDTDAYDTDAYDTADKQTTQTAARGIVQGDETQTTSQTSRRHRRQREELVQGYDSLQSEDLNDKVRGHNLYD